MSSAMDWFWCILLSFLAIRLYIKLYPRKRKQVETNPTKPDLEQIQRLQYEEELRKKGYSDEIIAVILPTIMND